MINFNTFAKIAYECGRFGQINCCQRLQKVAKSLINCPIWSHWIDEPQAAFDERCDFLTIQNPTNSYTCQRFLWFEIILQRGPGLKRVLCKIIIIGRTFFWYKRQNTFLFSHFWKLRQKIDFYSLTQSPQGVRYLSLTHTK